MPAEDCVRRFVPALGDACAVEGGWRVDLSDGTSLTTHGHDPILPRNVNAPAPIAPECATDPRTQPHGVLVYAHPSDQPNLYGSRLNELRTAAGVANAMLRRESAKFSRAVDYRMLCANRVLVVNDAPLLTRLEDSTFETVVNGLRALGLNNPLAKYWVFFEGRPPGTNGVAGTGTLEYDDRLSAANRNNFGPSYGVVWGSSPNLATYMMHENGHNLGAVQLSAYHSTGAGHCTDGADVMCYADGGPRANQYNGNVCATMHFDCGHDDYFHPSPPSDNPLSRRWNIGSPYNRFVAGCTYQTGVLVVGATGAEVDEVASRAHAIPSGCAGRPYAVGAWLVQPPVGVFPYTSAAPAVLPVPDARVCWYAGSSKIRCDGADRGTVPSGASSARVVLNTGAATAYVLSAI